MEMQEMEASQQDALFMEEMHFAAISAIAKAAPHISDDDLVALCWAAGVDKQDVKEQL